MSALEKKSEKNSKNSILLVNLVPEITILHPRKWPRKSQATIVSNGDYISFHGFVRYFCKPNICLIHFPTLFCFLKIRSCVTLLTFLQKSRDICLFVSLINIYSPRETVTNSKENVYFVALNRPIQTCTADAIGGYYRTSKPTEWLTAPKRSEDLGDTPHIPFNKIQETFLPDFFNFVSYNLVYFQAIFHFFEVMVQNFLARTILWSAVNEISFFCAFL